MKQETVTMVALRDTYYRGQVIPEGRTFQADPHFVNVLTKLKSAKVFIVEAEPESDKRKYKRRDMQATD